MDQTPRAVNPYRAPNSVVGRAQGLPTLHEAPRRGWFRWPLVFAINLIVPLMWATSLVNRHGKVGMLAAIPVLYVIGWATCRIHPVCARSMLNGGALVAVTQLFPIFQILAGLFALSVVGFEERFDQIASVGFPNERGGFLVTLLVGGLLMGLAFSVGATVEALTTYVKKWPLAGMGLSAASQARARD